MASPRSVALRLGRIRGLVRRHPAWTAALLTFIVAAGGLTATQQRSQGTLPAGVAVRDALRDRSVQQMLAPDHWTSAKASAIDGQLERVEFSTGHQVVAEVALTRQGRVAHAYEFAHQPVPYGNWIAYEPAVLLALSLLFVVMTAVLPLWRLRNLDVLAVLSLLVPVMLLQHRYVDASVLSATPGLGFLLCRAAARGLGRETHPRESPSTPLFEVIGARMSARDRNRLLWLLLFTLGLVFVMVGVSSSRAVDVVYAVMEGATRIIHGVLPYGHLPGDVVHGDTYPILSYLTYVPLALLAPVTSTWDSVDLALGFTVLAALGSAIVVARAAGRGSGGSPHEQTNGLRAAVAWLSFPPLLIAVSSGTTDILLAAMLAFAVLLIKRPRASIAVLAFAGWFKLVPFALIPLWLAPMRRRRLLSAVAQIAAIAGLMLSIVVLFGGVGGVGAMLRGLSYQASRGSPQSLWSILGIPWLQPLGEAGALALIATAVVRIRRQPDIASDAARMAASAAAILLALQLVASYWSFLYCVWVVPLLCISVLGEVPLRHSRTEREGIEPVRVRPRVGLGAAGA